MMSAVRLDNKKLRHWPDSVFVLKAWNEDAVKSIDVGGNELPDVDPRIAQFKETLVMLRLCGNKIAVLPPALLELGALKKLDVSSNPLIGLPEALQDSLVSLVELCCSGCGLAALPPLDRLVNLEILRCGQNTLTKLPEALPSALIELHGDENRLTEVSSASFGGCARLRVLRLAHNPTLRSAALAPLVSLVTLDLRQCKYVGWSGVRLGRLLRD
jgi:Leucine-rich repeat (LRR) protein